MCCMQHIKKFLLSNNCQNTLQIYGFYFSCPFPTFFLFFCIIFVYVSLRNASEQKPLDIVYAEHKKVKRIVLRNNEILENRIIEGIFQVQLEGPNVTKDASLNYEECPLDAVQESLIVWTKCTKGILIFFKFSFTIIELERNLLLLTRIRCEFWSDV